MQATTTIAKATLNAAPIRGQVTDASVNYQIDLAWDGARLEGRLGGWWFPEKTSLQRSPHGLIGHVSSRSVQITVNVRLADERLELLFSSGGSIQTIDLELTEAPSGIWRGGSVQHTPIRLERTATGWVAFAGQQRVALNASSCPDWVMFSAALVGLVAQREVSVAMLESLKALREQ